MKSAFQKIPYSMKIGFAVYFVILLYLYFSQDFSGTSLLSRFDPFRWWFVGIFMGWVMHPIAAAFVLSATIIMERRKKSRVGQFLKRAIVDQGLLFLVDGVFIGTLLVYTIGYNAGLIIGCSIPGISLDICYGS